ncbi:MAG: hypothetical protein IPO09_02935 [Anaeromyxobacter sp.]|nr:hypothetical protein [Anaeromyxobacter sp.]MBL0275538.1 hypothetical protein [Anaeromyxobacter sp.]
MTTFSRLIAAATLISATTFAPSLAAADGRQDGSSRRDQAGQRFEDRDQRRDDDRVDDRRDDRRDGRPVAAHVHDRSCGHDPRLLPPAPAPAWDTRDDLRWNGRSWVQAGWSRRDARERVAQARFVRVELRQLDQERAAYHARFAFHPRKLARFDARYFDRRASLERRLQTLTWYASR